MASGRSAHPGFETGFEKHVGRLCGQTVHVKNLMRFQQDPLVGLNEDPMGFLVLAPACMLEVEPVNRGFPESVTAFHIQP